MLCVCVYVYTQGGDKVVCGDGEGAVMLYNWGLWEDITDRFPVHAESVDCLLRISDSVICTGCMDGWVRYGKHVGTAAIPAAALCLG